MDTHLDVLEVLRGAGVVHLDGVIEDDQRVPDEQVGHVAGQRLVHAAVEEGALGRRVGVWVCGCVGISGWAFVLYGSRQGQQRSQPRTNVGGGQSTQAGGMYQQAFVNTPH
jgi:hypothetical protein